MPTFRSRMYTRANRNSILYVHRPCFAIKMDIFVSIRRQNSTENFAY